MVKTLDFHSNNVGSIPTSLILNMCRIKVLSKVVMFTGNNVKNKSFVHSIKLATIYIPSSTKAIRLGISVNFSSIKSSRTFNKILIKQSYVILVWLHYLSSVSSSSQGDNSALGSNQNIPSFFIYPPRKQSFTLTKSPMAHKTFSQEQFCFKKYKLSISFRSADCNLVIPDINSSVYFFQFILRIIPYVSTNLFLLQRYTLVYYSGDIRFFSLGNDLS